MGEIFTVDDIRRTSWREDLEERQNYEDERRKRELAKEQKQQQARKAREAAEKQQAAANNSEAWEHFVDSRVHQWIVAERDFMFDDVAKGLAGLRDKLRDELKRAVEKERRAFEAKLAELRERFLASNNQATWVSWVDDRIKATFAYGRDVLLADVADIVGGAERSFETKLVALEERLKATPGTLPAVKTYRPDTVHYAGHLVVHQGATYQALRDTARAPSHDDWVCLAIAAAMG
jgi:hypothetical protein